MRGDLLPDGFDVVAGGFGDGFGVRGGEVVVGYAGGDGGGGGEEGEEEEGERKGEGRWGVHFWLVVLLFLLEGWVVGCLEMVEL